MKAKKAVKTVTKAVKKVVKKAPAKKPAAKKAPAKKSPARKAVKKVVKRAAKAVKAAVKRVVKAVTQKAPAKKAAAKKAAVKKAPVKKAAVNKAPVKKAAAKKSPVKKATAVRGKTETPIKKLGVKQALFQKGADGALAKKPVVVDSTPTIAREPWPLMDTIMAALDDAKAEAVMAIDLKDRSSMADGMVIATGRVNRHVAAIADQLVDKLKAFGQRDIRVEGLDQGDWVLVDAGNVIVHIFRPEVRSFYNLEKLWSEHAPVEQREG